MLPSAVFIVSPKATSGSSTDCISSLLTIISNSDNRTFFSDKGVTHT